MERDFLLGKREFSKEQQYYIKSRLLKKVKALYGIELPLLEEGGYLAACSKNLAAGCKVSKEGDSLIRIPPQTFDYNEREKEEVGRKGFEPSVPAMSRRYPNQARPPAPYTRWKICCPNICHRSSFMWKHVI
jgi:hypothetical protein